VATAVDVYQRCVRMPICLVVIGNQTSHLEFPNCWNIELECSQVSLDQGGIDLNDDDSDDEDEGDDDEDEVDPEGGPGRGSQPTAEKSTKPSLSYQEFLQFLQLGCLGSPVQGYPAVVVILSTIPSSVSFFFYICIYVLNAVSR
jgi:hypothetical protein